MTTIDKKVYSVREYCEEAGLHKNTVYDWIKRGKLETTQKRTGGKHLIPYYEMPSYIRENGK